MDIEKEHVIPVEEDDDGPERPSDMQNRLDALNELREFEKQGHHAHALEEVIDPTKDKIIAHEIEELGETQEKPSEKPGNAPCEDDEDDCFRRTNKWAPQRKYQETYVRWLRTGRLI